MRKSEHDAHGRIAAFAKRLCEFDIAGAYADAVGAHRDTSLYCFNGFVLSYLRFKNGGIKVTVDWEHLLVFYDWTKEDEILLGCR